MVRRLRSTDGRWEIRQQRGGVLVIYRRYGDTVAPVGSARTLPDLEAKLQEIAGIGFADLVED